MGEIHRRAVERVKGKFPEGLLKVDEFRGETTLSVKREKVIEILRLLKEDEELSFNYLMDLCGVDNLGEVPRFEVIYQLYSFRNNGYLRVKAGVPEADIHVGTATGLWQAADWFEREAFDMFGILFDGHPNLSRILMWDGYDGFPLRKEFPIKERDKSIAPFGA